MTFEGADRAPFCIGGSMFKEYLERVHQLRPVIHSITNYVTVNDVANILLALGASPIMADDPGEVEEITALSSGLYINIGTLNERTIPSMEMAAKKAGDLSLPWVLDPVGAGASKLRTWTSLSLIDRYQPDVIRGNLSEIRALALDHQTTRGVDAEGDEELLVSIDLVVAYARKTASIIAATGPVDIVSDGQDTILLRNGHPDMEKVTGTGCQLSALVPAFLAASPKEPLKAASAAVALMGLAGELAREQLAPGEGNVSYRNHIIDQIFLMTPKIFGEKVRYEIR